MDTGLTMKNALLVVHGPSGYCLLDGNGGEIGQRATRRSPNPDWRNLLNRVSNAVDLWEKDPVYDKPAVAHWLNDAGYRTADGKKFTSRKVTEDILGWLFERQVIFTWGMGALTPSTTQRYIRRYQRYGDNVRNSIERMRRAYRTRLGVEPSRLGHPKKEDKELFQALGNAPEGLDIPIWETFLVSMGALRNLRTKFRVDDRARFVVDVETESPMHALTLTLFIDRVFNKRNTRTCKECGDEFVPLRRTQQFCERRPSHEKRWTTRFNAHKKAAVRRAEEHGGTPAEIARKAQLIFRKEYPNEQRERTAIHIVAKKKLRRK
jgi:hypothetical protein